MPTQFYMQIEPYPVVLSCAISFLGSYAAITTFEQYRLCRYLSMKPRMFRSEFELVIVSLLLGGVSIWTMHFVGMSSCSLMYPNMFNSNGNRVPAPMFYRLDYTIISLIAVILLCYVGIYFSSRDDLFSKDRTDAIADFYEHSKTLSIQDIKRQGKYSFLFQTLFRGMGPLCLGGFFTAVGVCVMHYLGMVAIQFEGHIEWNQGIVATSVIIALIAATAAYWILFRLLVIFPSVELLRIASAFIAMIAVNGMHYTGMAAATFVYDPNHNNTSAPSNLVGADTAMIGAIAAGVLMSFIGLALALNDLRGWFYDVASVMRELDLHAKLASDVDIESNSINIVDSSFLDVYTKLRSKTRSGRSRTDKKQLVKMRLDHKRNHEGSASSESIHPAESELSANILKTSVAKSVIEEVTRSSSLGPYFQSYATQGIVAIEDIENCN